MFSAVNKNKFYAPFQCRPKQYKTL